MPHPQQNVFLFFWEKNINVCKFSAPTLTECFIWKITFNSSMMPFFFSFLFFARSFPIFISLIHYGRKEAPTPPASELMYRWEGGFSHMLLLLLVFGEQQQLQMCVGGEWRVMPWMMSNRIWHLHSFRPIANPKATSLLWTEAWMPPSCREKLCKTSGLHFWMK